MRNPLLICELFCVEVTVVTKRIGRPCVILRLSAPFRRSDEQDGRTYNSRHVLFFSPVFFFFTSLFRTVVNTAKVEVRISPSGLAPPGARRDPGPWQPGCQKVRTYCSLAELEWRST